MDERGGNPRSVLDTLKICENATIERVRAIVEKEAANYLCSHFRSPGIPFYLLDLIELENQALEFGEVKDAVVVWPIPLYAQRKYWFKLFI